MAAVKTKLGRIPCDCCGHPSMLKENEAGTLTIACDECDVSAFAKKGTSAAAKWRAKLSAAPAAQASESVPKAPAPAPAAPAAGAQPKAPKPPASPFDPLGFLNKPKAAA